MGLVVAPLLAKAFDRERPYDSGFAHDPTRGPAHVTSHREGKDCDSELVSSSMNGNTIFKIPKFFWYFSQH